LQVTHLQLSFHYFYHFQTSVWKVILGSSHWMTSDELNVPQFSCCGKWKLDVTKQMSLHHYNQNWVYSCHRPLCMFCSSSSSPNRLDTVDSCTHRYCIIAKSAGTGLLLNCCRGLIFILFIFFDFCFFFVYLTTPCHLATWNVQFWCSKTPKPPPGCTNSAENLGPDRENQIGLFLVGHWARFVAQTWHPWATIQTHRVEDASAGAYATHNNIKNNNTYNSLSCLQAYSEIMRFVYTTLVML